jgi:rubrerythrin
MVEPRVPGRFRKTPENFTCENCGVSVAGNGYTDHCPKCLYGRHVDIMPGDRSEKCRGMMKPVHAFYKDGSYTISYRCLKCGIERRFKAAPDDNTELLLSLLK